VRRTIARIGPAELPALWSLRRADLRARGRLVSEGLENQARLESHFQMELQRASALKIAALAIGGREVMEALAVPPGPLIGRVLAKLLERALDEPEMNTRERLLDLVPEAARALSTGNPQA